jgi:hypothetical protein
VNVSCVRANLLDEDELLVDTVTVNSDQNYTVNDWFKSPDGGLYVLCEVKPGEPPIDVEITGVWFDGPHPTLRLGGHS